MREIRSPGSVRGAARKGRPYRDQGTQGSGDEWAVSPKHEPRYRETPPEVNDFARRLIEAAAEVHRHLGPGVAESV